MKPTKEQIQVQCDTVVNQLKELRESEGITTAKLSEMTDIAQPNITRTETGGSAPNLKTIILMATALDAEVRIVKRKKKSE